jgi:hypothetical protein
LDRFLLSRRFFELETWELELENFLREGWRTSWKKKRSDKASGRGALRIGVSLQLINGVGDAK